MSCDSIEFDSQHKRCIIGLINKIVTKSPHLTELKSDSIVFIRLVSVISLIETTLCSKYQIVLKRKSTDSESIELIKSWLKQYYTQEFVTSLCQNKSQTIDNNNEIEKSFEAKEELNESKAQEVYDNTPNANESNYRTEDIDRDIALIALMVLLIAHKLRQSLPRINAYFSPEWQTLSQFDSNLKHLINFEKLLDLVQNELCAKRKQLEVTKSKVLSLQSTISSRISEQNKQKRLKIDYRSNLFAEYEDNDTNDGKDLVNFEENEDYVSDNSDGSAIFVDHSSDDDYKPDIKSQKLLAKSSVKKPTKRGSIGKRSGRGRGRPSKDSLSPIRVTPQTKSGHKSRGRPAKPKANPIAVEGESDEAIESGEPFECESCGKRFAKEYRLTRHSFTHLGRKQFCCDFPDCNESFDLKWKLSEHKVEHNGHNGAQEDDSFNSSNNYFQCEWADCGLGFTSKRELTVHEHEMHANRSTSKYSCDWPQCREIFENKIDWRKHVRTHGKIVPTECGFPGCHKSFFKLDSLENHRKIHETFTLDELS